jgi:hypothetical protein
VFQLARDDWTKALDALGFREIMEAAGFSHLAVC